MRRFNKLDASPARPVQPLVYQTFQAYLRRSVHVGLVLYLAHLSRRTPEYLQHSLDDAQQNNYALGVKLVRGAYHPHELSAHGARGTARSVSMSPDAAPPVWGSKPETDATYDACVRTLVAAVTADVRAPTDAPRVGVLFGTHNRASCTLVLDELERAGLARKSAAGVFSLDAAVTGRITMGQLYGILAPRTLPESRLTCLTGMHDALTNELADKTRSATPFVIKYVPYGGLKEVSVRSCEVAEWR
jgi:proline dehydrogenase